MHHQHWSVGMEQHSPRQTRVEKARQQTTSVIGQRDQFYRFLRHEFINSRQQITIAKH